MSALNVTQDEADLLLTGLKMLADVQRNAGVVSDDVTTLMAKIAPAPAVESAPTETVAAEPVVAVEVPKAKKTKVVEE
jgi:hypothetical protein